MVDRAEDAELLLGLSFNAVSASVNANATDGNSCIDPGSVTAPSRPTPRPAAPLVAAWREMQRLRDPPPDDSAEEVRLPASLTSEERRLAHAMAEDMGLNHVSVGAGKDRCLVLSRKH